MEDKIMGFELYKVREHMGHMEQLAQGILKHAAQIKEIQDGHPHVWTFSFQTNAYHQTLWNVGYQCNGCGAHRFEKKWPVCEKCDIKLKRCNSDDKAAERQRKKPEYQDHLNSPLAFRCPKCRKIHILWHEGD